MSKYCWERGTLKIPTRAYNPLKKALWEYLKAQAEKEHTIAMQCHALLAKHGEFKRATNQYARENIITELVKGKTFVQGYLYGWRCDPEEVADTERIVASLSGKGYTLKRPLKKDFTGPQLKDLSVTVDRGTAYIRFDDKAHTVTWSVPEGNRVVDDAHAALVAKKFFELLGNITWTRGSGGTIVGNDEYNCESEYEGGGGNYVTHRYGPAGDEDRPRMPRRRKATTVSKPSAPRTTGRIMSSPFAPIGYPRY